MVFNNNKNKYRVKIKIYLQIKPKLEQIHKKYKILTLMNNSKRIVQIKEIKSNNLKTNNKIQLKKFLKLRNKIFKNRHRTNITYNIIMLIINQINNNRSIKNKILIKIQKLNKVINNNLKSKKDYRAVKSYSLIKGIKEM